MSGDKQIPRIGGDVPPAVAKILEPMRQRIESLGAAPSADDKVLRNVVLQIVRGSGVLTPTPTPQEDLQPFFDGLAQLTKKAQDDAVGISQSIAVNADMAFDALGRAEANLASINSLSTDLAGQATDLAQQALDLLDLATDVTALQTTVGDLSTDFIATSTLLDATVSRVDVTEDSIDVITASITSLQAELVDTTAFDPGIVWQFEGTLDGWTSNFTLATGDYFVSVPDDAGTYLRSPSAIAIDGRLYTKIIARIRRTGGTGWLGRASYATAGSGSHAIDTTNFQLTLATEPIFAGGGWVIVVWDMEMLSAGGSDWVDAGAANSRTVDQIQLELSDDSSTTFDVDWVAIGRTAPSFFSGSLSALTSRVTATEGAITALSSDVTSLESRATDLEGDVSANTTAISTLSTRVTSTEDSIDVNSSDITSLSSRVTSAEGNITSTSTALSALTTRVTSAEGVNTTQSTSITTLTSGLASANTAITSNASAITGLDTRVTSAEGVNTSQGSAITALQSTVNDGSTGVAATATALTNLTTRVTSAEGVNTTQAGQITSINSAITDATTGLSANASAINSVQTQVNTIGSSVSISAQQVSLLSVRQSNGESLVNPLTSPGNNADWDVPAFGVLDPNEIAVVNIGGRTRAAARLRTSTNGLQRISRSIEIDQSSIYEVRFSVLKTTANGRIYLGMYASSDGTSTSNSGVFPVINRQVVGGAENNPYFFIAGTTGAHSLFEANKWYDVIAYICGADAPLNRVPAMTINGFRPLLEFVPGLNPPTVKDAFQLPTSARFVNLRCLNADNSAQVDLFLNNVGIRRVFGRDAGIDQEISDRQAAISTEQTARISGDSAVASSVTTVSTQVAGNSASINTLTTSVNGLNAQFVLQLNNNGRITGLKLAGSPNASSAIFQVDQFSIALPGPGPAVVPFTVGTVNGVATVGINGNLVVDGTIITRKLLDQSVTTPKMAPNSVRRTTSSNGGAFNNDPFNRVIVNTASITITDSLSTLRVDWGMGINHQFNNDPANKLFPVFLVFVNGGLSIQENFAINSRNFLGEVYPNYTRSRVYGPGFGVGSVVTVQLAMDSNVSTSQFGEFQTTSSLIILAEELR